MTPLEAQLLTDEGLKLRPYTDTAGKLTIGIGRNLQDVGISQEEALYLLRNDIITAKKTLSVALPWTSDLDSNRLDALTNMCFNLGINRLKGFHNFLAALQAKDWTTASSEMLSSLWAHQVGARAVRLAKIIKDGQ